MSDERSPLRDNSPNRYQANQRQEFVERVLVNNAASQDHKDRLVAQLRQEAMDLRVREREYKVLQDQLLALEQSFNRVTDDKRRMEEDYKSRVEANINMVSSLR